MTSVSVELWLSAIALVLFVGQIPAIALWLARLMQGPTRMAPLRPKYAKPQHLGSVSVVVPTLNEAHRIQPCLDGLTRQGSELREVLVVDSNSTDGTADVVKAMQPTDPRFRVLTDDPLPAGWVGRPWALHYGFCHSAEAGQWVLGIDADTHPQPGLIASLLHTAEQEGYDLITLAPRFMLKGAAEWWLQPALLMTLLFRFGPAGIASDQPERVMANGQCMLIRRSLLVDLGGYSLARRSFCDDVTLARCAASQGAKVGFLDGSRLLSVRMYEGAAEVWKEWGRSLDLKDACTPAQTWGDFGYLLAVQALPWLMTILGAIALGLGYHNPVVYAATATNGGLILIRFALLIAILPSYHVGTRSGFWAFWLSPLADVAAVWRIFLSSVRTPTQWRGRTYSPSIVHGE
ncbi:2'-O-glycosyltransferase CruG [Leptolyngbya sp. AN02str]|uniref:2'-O-glycosyltransferase CruG n=1 Tax=Leptolyngbya sp. AN02str TaxID=3423363 RepID=UPI003D323ABA